MKKYRQLSHEERYRIAALKRSGFTQAAIARELSRHPATISRELRRNATNHDGTYRAEKAQQYSTARRRRARRGSHFSAAQWASVEHLLRRYWSPEQVANVIQARGEWSISHETILPPQIIQ